MACCFEESRLAYVSGDRGLAKALSNEGKEHKERMEWFNAEASDWIFASRSRSLPPMTQLDLTNRCLPRYSENNEVRMTLLFKSCSYLTPC